MFLLGKPYEVCRSCEVLKQQLAIANDEKAQLTETLLSLLKPKVYETAPQELRDMRPLAVTFTRRRAALEAKDREEARILRNSTVIGKADDELAKLRPGPLTAEQLEAELGVAGEPGEEAR